MSQNKQLTRYFRTGNSLTSLEAAKKFAITKLPNRISELEDKGLRFNRIEHESSTPGAAGNYFEYSLKEDE